MAQVANEDADVLNIYDENDLFLTNAYTNDKEQDKSDKKRYYKPTTAYFYVNSASRNNPMGNLFGESTLTSTGNHYTDIALFFPYDSISTSLPITKIQFKIRDITHPSDIKDIVSGIINSETSQDSTIFEVYIPVDTLTNYTLGVLATTIKNNLNNILYRRASTQLGNSVDPNHMFNVSAHIDALLNPDKITISITCQSNFEFLLNFIFDTGTNVIETYPNPNRYTIFLDKNYSNIKRLRIIDADITFSDTIINEWNNIIEFKLKDHTGTNIYTIDGSLTWRLILEFGNYNNSVSTFLSYLLLSLNTYIFSQSGIVDLFSLDAYNPSNEIITLRIQPMYTFEFEFISDDKYGSRNLYRMLGFNTPSTSAYTSVFSNTVKINTGKICYEKPYTRISFATSKIIWIAINNYECIYYFNKFPINRLQTIDYTYIFSTDPHMYKLDISLFDENGLPYNTNMVDHSFTLEILYHIDRITGTDISSYRGLNNVDHFDSTALTLKPDTDNIVH